MENELIKLALSQGLWSALSVTLIFYILKKQENRDENQNEREKNYQNIISNLTDKLGIVEVIQKDIRNINQYVYKKNNF